MRDLSIITIYGIRKLAINIIFNVSIKFSILIFITSSFQLYTNFIFLYTTWNCVCSVLYICIFGFNLILPDKNTPEYFVSEFIRESDRE